MEIPDAVRGKISGDNFRLAVTQKSEKALAIKQSWQQALNVLDINFDHGSLNYSFDQNTELMRVALMSQAQSQHLLVDGADLTYDEVLSGNCEYTLYETERVSVAKQSHSTSLSMIDIGLERPIFTPPTAYAENPVILNASVGIGRKIASGNDNQNVQSVGIVTKKGDSLLTGNIFMHREAVAKDVTQRVSGSASANVLLAVKQDANATQPSQVSLTKVEGGVMILARDYRANEKVFTKKLVDSLKSILLAGGVLKKILMNGKTIF